MNACLKQETLTHVILDKPKWLLLAISNHRHGSQPLPSENDKLAFMHQIQMPAAHQAAFNIKPKLKLIKDVFMWVNPLTLEM